MADEPTGNLDSRNANSVMDLLHELHGDGATIVSSLTILASLGTPNAAFTCWNHARLAGAFTSSAAVGTVK